MLVPRQVFHKNQKSSQSIFESIKQLIKHEFEDEIFLFESALSFQRWKLLVTYVILVICKMWGEKRFIVVGD